MEITILQVFCSGSIDVIRDVLHFYKLLDSQTASYADWNSSFNFSISFTTFAPLSKCFFFVFKYQTTEPLPP